MPFIVIMVAFEILLTQKIWSTMSLTPTITMFCWSTSHHRQKPLLGLNFPPYFFLPGFFFKNISHSMLKVYVNINIVIFYIDTNKVNSNIENLYVHSQLCWNLLLKVWQITCLDHWCGLSLMWTHSFEEYKILSSRLFLREVT